MVVMKTEEFLAKLKTSGHWNEEYDYSKLEYVSYHISEIKTNTMDKITLSGIVLFKHEDEFERVKLVQDNGYEIDLILRFQEAMMNHKGHMMKVEYWTSDQPCTEDEMKEEFLRRAFGDPKVGYDKNDYCYSSWTWGTDYDTNLRIGGHDIMSELYGEKGKFLLLNLEFEKKSK